MATLPCTRPYPSESLLLPAAPVKTNSHFIFTEKAGLMIIRSASSVPARFFFLFSVLFFRFVEKIFGFELGLEFGDSLASAAASRGGEDALSEGSGAFSCFLSLSLSYSLSFFLSLSPFLYLSISLFFSSVQSSNPLSQHQYPLSHTHFYPPPTPPYAHAPHLHTNARAFLVGVAAIELHKTDDWAVSRHINLCHLIFMVFTKSVS